MTDHHYDLVMVYDRLGTSVRIKPYGTASVLDPITGAPLTVVQNGQSVTGTVTGDANGRVSMVAQQGYIKMVSGGLVQLLTSSEAASSGAANAAAAQAAQAAAQTSATNAATSATNAAASASSASSTVSSVSGRVTTVETTIGNLTGTTFNLATTPAHYLIDAGLFSHAVMQCAARLPATGEYYVAQSTGTNAAGYETNTISRLTADGTLLDSMTLDGGGHGHTIAVRTVGANVEIFGWTWDEPLTGGRASGDQLVKFNYAAGTTLTKADAGGKITILPMFDSTGTQYVLTACDWANDRAAFHVGHGDGTVDFYLRSIAEFEAGVDNVLGHVGPLSTATQYQGHTTLEGKLYRYLGTGTATNHSIECYDFTTGALVSTVDTNNLGKVAGVWPGGSCEPEGITAYTDPVSGHSSLIVGMSVGDVVASRSRLYEFSQLEPRRGQSLRAVLDTKSGMTTRREGIWYNGAYVQTANYSHTYSAAFPNVNMTITSVTFIFDQFTIAPSTTNYWVFKLQRTRAGVTTDIASMDTTGTTITAGVPVNLPVSAPNIAPGDLITVRCNIGGAPAAVKYPIVTSVSFTTP